MPTVASISSASGNAVFRWLRTGGMGLDAMLAAIGEATVSIALETYIFTPGPLGTRFLNALVAARQRGVRVQVLVDALGSIGLISGFWAPLIRAGGEFRWFSAFSTSQRYGRRNHRKLLIIDSRIAFIGGFNIGEVYYGDGVSQGWRDLGMELQGPVVEILAASFVTLFAKANSRPALFPQLLPMPESTIAGPNWTLLLSEPGRGHRALKRSLIRDLARARRVRMICAYFLPPWRLRRAMMRAARRGAEVQLILAGLTDVPVSKLASSSLYGKLMRAGIQIFEYQPQILHAKLVLIDDVVYVGSANLDTRSLNINYELTVRLNDLEAAKEAREIFESDLAHCRRLHPAVWRTRGMWTRLLERVAYLLLARVDPYIARLRWQRRTHEVLEQLDS
ncbi:MAG: phosphatidylserine/phosphatidylglycerophosphate/cardiolipin synthase family protein [Verrucomicrobiota bacterium]